MPIQDSLLQLQEGMATYIKALNAQKRALLRRIKLANKLKSDLKKLADDNTGEELTDDLAKLAADITAAAQQLGPDLNLVQLTPTPAQPTPKPAVATPKAGGKDGKKKTGSGGKSGTRRATTRKPAATQQAPVAAPTPTPPPAPPTEVPARATRRRAAKPVAPTTAPEGDASEEATTTRRYFGMAHIAIHFLIPAFGPAGIPETFEDALDRMAEAHPAIYPNGWRVKEIRVLNEASKGFENRTIEDDISRPQSTVRNFILQGVQRGLMVMNDQAPAGKTVKPSLMTLAELFRKLPEDEIGSALSRWGFLSDSTEVEAGE